MRKFIPGLVIVIGLVLVVLSLAADVMGFGGQTGFGPRQILILGFGVLIISGGVFLAFPKGRMLIDRMIDRLESVETGKQEPREILINYLIMAAWFGLVIGLVEGLALWVFRRLNWFLGSYYYLGNSLEIIWISAGFDLLLFLSIGLILGGVGFVSRRVIFYFIGIYLFVWIACLDFLVILLNRWVDFYPLIVLSAGVAIWPARWLMHKRNTARIFFRHSLPWVAGLAIFALVTIQGGFWLREELAVSRLPQANPVAPNIVVIVVDALRADHLSSYGYERQTTPNIDRLASEGILFENAIATSSWTPPSHASLFTGRYVYEHGADLKPLDYRYPTIAEDIQKLGYRTGAFLGNYENLNRTVGLARGFQRYEDYYQSLGSMVNNTLLGHLIIYEGLHRVFGMDNPVGRKLASQINDSTLDWIDRHPENPFFIFINYFDTHDPYTPPQPYRSKFSSVKNPGGLINSYWDEDHIYILSSPEQLQEEIDAYDGAIAYVDDKISQFIEGLQKRGLTENTIVIILSDHGESFGEHGLLHHHNSLYREMIHVPLIFWGPEQLPGGLRITQPVSIAAIPATVLNLVMDSEQSIFPLESLSKLWEQPGMNSEWPDPIAEVTQVDWVADQHLTKYGDIKSVISSAWHYIQHEQIGEELFDWVNDPDELNNRIDDPELKEEIIKIRSYLSKQITP